jgi:small-conductance mechanosensitive channel
MEVGVANETVQHELTSLWRSLMVDLRGPDIIWQVLALLVCLGLAKLIERMVHHRPRGEGRVVQLGQGTLRRLAFPLVALLLVMLARPLLKPLMNVNLLSLAIPLLGSLAAIRMVFYVLRHSFPTAGWLRFFERSFALAVWTFAALHITGVLPEVIDVLEAYHFTLGKQKLTLWVLFQGLAAVLATMFGALWLGSLIEDRLTRADGIDGNLQVVFARLARALLILLALLISLPLVGIDLTMLSVFGGALGVGLGFGLQKIASNYVSGFIILLDHSIRIGNLISVGNDRGVVTRITTRYTVLRGMTGVEALVPNELLVSAVVLNESFSDPKVRVGLPVQVGYECDVERAMAIMVAAATAQERVLADPVPTAFLLSFADSGINLELGFWIADPENGTAALRSAINLRIWHDFQAAGIGIPYPQREVRVIQGTSNV